eukprot:SAG11_NODE_5478_length_1550_cov_1.304618_1_plen_145_part_00
MKSNAIMLCIHVTPHNRHGDGGVNVCITRTGGDGSSILVPEVADLEVERRLTLYGGWFWHFGLWLGAGDRGRRLVALATKANVLLAAAAEPALTRLVSTTAAVTDVGAVIAVAVTDRHILSTRGAQRRLGLADRDDELPRRIRF